MKILLVDDHALVRSGIASLLAAHNIEVVGEASDGEEAFAKARELKPDIILMDIKMPNCNGLEATRLIKAAMPEIKIIMLTVSDDDEDLFQAIKSGAEGYLLKNIRGQDFIAMLHGVAKGEAAISPMLAAKMIEELRYASHNPAPPQSRLTEREIHLLNYVAKGAMNKEIATALNITENTVKYHLRNIMEKLHLSNRAQVAAYAVRKGLTSESPKTPGT